MCVELIEQRRADGSTDDIIGILTQAFDEGALAQAGDGAFAGDVARATDEGLTHDELIMFLILLVVAGNETTRNALTGGLVAFSRFPDQHRKLLDEPGPDRPGRRRDRPLRQPGHVLHAHGDRGPHASRRRRASSWAGERRVPALPVGQPRRGRVRRRPTSSASTATPTRTSASASAPTTAWAPTWPGPRSASCSPSCSPDCATSGPSTPQGSTGATPAWCSPQPPPRGVHPREPA